MTFSHVSSLCSQGFVLSPQRLSLEDRPPYQMIPVYFSSFIWATLLLCACCLIFFFFSSEYLCRLDLLSGLFTPVSVSLNLSILQGYEFWLCNLITLLTAYALLAFKKIWIENIKHKIYHSNLILTVQFISGKYIYIVVHQTVTTLLSCKTDTLCSLKN